MSTSSGRHVRTRTGCWTCRLRKKKCDEARPACNQCTHLRLTCDGYDEQPVWMRDDALGDMKKAEIKKQMVRKSRRKKKSQAQKADSEKVKKEKKEKVEVSSPPSIKAPKKPNLKFKRDDSPDTITSDKSTPQVSAVEINDLTEQVSGIAVATNGVNLERDVKVESETFRSSTSPTSSQDYPMSETSTIPSTYLSVYNTLATVGEEMVEYEDEFRNRITSIDSSMDNYDDDDDDESQESQERSSSADSVLTRLHDNSIQTMMPVTGKVDVNLVKLYVKNIFHVTYRALSNSDVFKYNEALILPMFYENKSFFHGCLSSSALHMTATPMSTAVTKNLKTQVYKHRSLSLHYLKKQVAKKTNYEHIIATICALISFEVYSRTTNWVIHVRAATDCVRQLDWMNNPPTDNPANWFMFSRVIWLDILGSLTRGQPSYFAEHYHKMLFLPPSMRYRYKIGELIGCDDSIMFILSEAVCLEAWKLERLSEGGHPRLYEELQRRGELLDGQLVNKDNNTDVLVNDSPSDMHTDVDMTENGDYPSPPWTEEGSDRPGFERGSSEYGVSTLDGDDDDDDDDSIASDEFEDFATLRQEAQEMAQIEGVVEDKTGTIEELPDHTIFSNAITASFRAAARIYIATIIYGYNPHHAKLEFLLEELMLIISGIPSGPAGYDRSIVAPLLIGGSIATEEEDRNFFLSRCRKIKRLAKYGNLGSVDMILREVWARADVGDFDHVAQVPWRQVMIDNKWQYLLV